MPEFVIVYEDMHDGTFHASAKIPGEGSVFLGYVGRNVIFAEEEVRAYVAEVLASRP